MKVLINRRGVVGTIQLLGWSAIVVTTLLWSSGVTSVGLDTFGLVMFSLNICMLLVIYLLNYVLFIPKCLFQNRHTSFFLFNLLLVAVLLLGSYIVNNSEFLNSLKPEIEVLPPPKSSTMYLARDLINYILMIGMVTALRLSERLERSEQALRDAENARVKAELDNLRSQINPHFLLNTLNNIYALTALDTERAQKSIKELSDLLRYILYENRAERVALIREVEFFKSYIELMAIRLPRKVSVKSEFKVAPDSATLVAPLVFISLLENAFKHSINANGEGFIEILFEDNVDREEVTLTIRNSNNAATSSDKSGHGIGLEQVRRRLELLYPNSYKWDVVENSLIYSSVLTLKSKR